MSDDPMPPAAGPQVHAEETCNTAPAPLATIGALIERWWHDHFPGSAVAHDTRAWNVAHAAMQDLKRRLGAQE